MRRFSRIFAWTTLFFVAGAVLFFTKAAALPYKVAWPVLLLSLATFLSRRRELLPFGFAFLFSAAGVPWAPGGLFIPQMAFFALAHAAYVCWFLPRAAAPGSVRFRWPSLSRCSSSFSPPSSPRPPFPAERIGVAVYGLVIAAMLYSALQYDGACAAGFRCAALLFVFSDAVIAWNRFIGPVPARTWIVMITYYLAQYLFFRFAFKTAARNLTLTAPVSPAAAGL